MTTRNFESANVEAINIKYSNDVKFGAGYYVADKVMVLMNINQAKELKNAMENLR